MSIESVPRRILPAGTRLWHGTNTAGDFEVPDGPAWFALTHKGAAEWVGWGGVCGGRVAGSSRVHEFESVADVELLDLFGLEDWRRVSLEMVGDPDGGTGCVAAALVDVAAGWVGEGEVMFTAPETKLKFVRRHTVTTNAD